MNIELFIVNAETGRPMASLGPIETFVGWTYSAKARAADWAREADTDQHGRRRTWTELWAMGYGLHRLA